MGVRLPAEYQEVEYIETTNKQYIQTSYTPQNADEIVCDFAVVGSLVSSANAQALFSAGTETNQLIFLLNKTVGTTPVDGAYYKYFASGNASRLFFYPSYDTKYRLEIDNDGTANCNGYSVQSHYEGTVDTALCLMQRAKGGSSFKGKCYQFILSNGGEEKLHLIPCYRKSDSKPGMYDLVTKQFFTNAGTGEFLVGPDVIESISPWLIARRRMLMRQYIGYEENKGFTGVYSNVSTGVVNGRFLTGFIPINGAKRVTCYYGGNITSGTMHYMVEYNGDKQYTNKDGYWDMTVKNQRTVTLYTSDVQYVRFSGFMNEIDQCYVKNADTGEILWKKGM